MNLLGIVALSILAVGYATDWEARLKAEDLAIRRWRKGDLILLKGLEATSTGKF